MTNYLVTGGAGFIGSHLVNALVDRGDRVHVLDDLSGGSLDNLHQCLSRIEFHEGSVLDGVLLNTIFRDVEVVFHQAALVSVPRSIEDPQQTHEICATGTLNVLQAARACGVRRVIYAGSSSCYGDATGSIQSESDVAAPISPYGAAKLAGEQYCHAFYRSFNLETVILRYFNVFGPRQDPASPYSAVIPLFIAAMLRGEVPTIFGDGLQTRDFTYIDNVVHGNLLAADATTVTGSPINLASGESISLLDVIALINRNLGTEIKPLFTAARAGDILHSGADIELAMIELGYSQQTSFAQGLQRTIEYYRSTGNGA